MVLRTGLVGRNMAGKRELLVFSSFQWVALKRDNITLGSRLGWMIN